MTDQAISARSRFLVAATTLACGWLFAFGLDGFLSLGDDLLKAFAGWHGLTDLRELVALAVLALSPFILLLLIITPPLPKRVFLPVVLCTIWANLIIWPLPTTPGPFTTLPVELLQIVFFIAALFRIHRQTGRFSLVATDLPVKRHPVRRAFISLGISIVALALLLAGFVGFGLTRVIERQTDGYLRFTWSGVEVADKTLVKEGRSVRLIGMVHIGETRFYEKLFASFPPDALVLTEGVSDTQKKLGGKFAYSNVAGALGLAEQGRLQAAWIARANKKADATHLAAPTARPAAMNADIDVAAFAPLTIRFLRDIAEVYSSTSKWQALQRMTAMNDKYTPDQITAVYADIIETRNANLLKILDKALKNRTTIIIPWGAEHMPGLEKALRDKGYTITTTSHHMVIRYASLF
jgi:hypothetical protein